MASSNAIGGTGAVPAATPTSAAQPSINQIVNQVGSSTVTRLSESQALVAQVLAPLSAGPAAVLDLSPTATSLMASSQSAVSSLLQNATLYKMVGTYGAQAVPSVQGQPSAPKSEAVQATPADTFNVADLWANQMQVQAPPAWTDPTAASTSAATPLPGQTLDASA